MSTATASTPAGAADARSELHIFDFDGTLFYSPVPDKQRLVCLYPRKGTLHAELLVAGSKGGLGWFQDLRTLSPPAVPLKPDVDRWFIGPVLQHFRQLIAEKKAGIGRDKKFFVLTGRDSKFQQRIEALLDHAGLLQHVSGVILKPSETYGTVKYKLEKFADLLGQHHPEAVFYYEDRPEQGAKLLLGVHQLQSQLFYSTRGAAAGSANPINPLGGGDQGHALPPQGSCHLVSFTAAGCIGPSILLNDLMPVEMDIKSSVQFGELWAMDHCETNGITSHRLRPAATVSEKVLLPFHFTMLLLKESLTEECERILTDSQLRQVVDLLIRSAAPIPLQPSRPTRKQLVEEYRRKSRVNKPQGAKKERETPIKLRKGRK